MDITFITGNPNKAAYLAAYCDTPITHQKLDLEEIQSLDLEEIVAHKAEQAFSIIKKPVLVEDVSLVFTDLGKLPGPFIKWFEKSLGNEGLCRLLDSYPDRSVVASTLYGLHDGTTIHYFGGSATGTVAQSPRGETSFGWDPIFIPTGHQRTWAEMSPDEKHQTDHRGPAVAKLAAFLKTLS